MRHFATVFLCVLGLASAIAQSGPPPLDSEWISWAGEFEGDIKLTESQLRQLNDSSAERNAIIGDSRRWPNAQIPYVITGEFSAAEIATIEKAFAAYASSTCLSMVKRTTEADYVNIVREGGCWSYVGRTGGVQKVSLVNGCIHQYIIIHEFMHAFGFFHEQSRTDRDTYVRIALENVKDGKENNFNSYTASQITALGEPYDYQSVMHYGAYDFSKNGQKTIVRLDGSEAALGNKVGFSQVDMNKLNKLYKCEGTATTTTVASTTAATTAPATTTVTTAGPATTTGACTDSFTFCRRIRKFCDDEDHAEDMAVACRKSCKICVNCDDKEKYETSCPIWKARGYCEDSRFTKFLKRNCKKSCEHC